MQNELKNELGTNFTEYAVAVITDRALPDARSGLKPVAKRILWESYLSKRFSSRPHVKCARIVGDTMGRWHPHGDSSIYGALVHLSQDWIMRYPLIDFHGNNGNITGDGPAHMRYTEARLSKISEQGMLKGINTKNVDFIPNYDETAEEPITLPAFFPNLLCNPNKGIAVGMACNWAPHNLNEVVDAISDYIHGKEPMLPGPDFPTGGIIINKNDIPAIMKTGKGSVKIRGKYTTNDKSIIFTEIPYGTTVENILDQIGEVCESKIIEGISNIRDETNKKGIRIVIDVKKGVDKEKVIAQLFTKTSLQSSFAYNQVALINKTPQELNLKQAIEVYVNHAIECIVKEAQFNRTKAQERLHIVNGLLIALEDIDNVINLIKKSKDKATASTILQTTYKLDEIQAAAILNMRLSTLAGMEKIKLENEKQSLETEIDKLTNLIDSTNEQQQHLLNILLDLKNKFGDARRTELQQIDIPKDNKIIIEQVIVSMNQNGDIKRIPRTKILTTHRKTAGVKLNDNVLATFECSTEDKCMILSNKGKAYAISVYNIPEGNNKTKGVNINTLLTLDKDEHVITIAPIKKDLAPCITFITKKGRVKRSLTSEYANIKAKRGVQAIKFKTEDDAVVQILLQNTEEDIILATKKGRGVKLKGNDIKPQGRITMGIQGIKLEDGDYVINAVPATETFLLVVGEDGKGRLSNTNTIETHLSNTKGNKYYPGNIGDIVSVNEEDSIMLITSANAVCIKVNEINVLNNFSTEGVILAKGRVNKVIKV